MIKSLLVIVKNIVFERKKISITSSSRSRFIVWPWHLDLNFHVNNAKYLNYCNQARLEFFSEFSVLSLLLKKKALPVIVKNEILYKKSLKLFNVFYVKTKIEKIEKKEIVVEHVIFHKEKKMSTCYTHIFVKGIDDLEDELKKIESKK